MAYGRSRAECQVNLLKTYAHEFLVESLCLSIVLAHIRMCFKQILTRGEMCMIQDSADFRLGKYS
jgi:hypothetical protein